MNRVAAAFARYLVLVALLVVALASNHAGAVALLPGSQGAMPVELRLAVALGPERSTLWAQVALEGNPGPVALVLPAPDGASLDLASEAWFEALEMATAPRIAPPEGLKGTCPGEPDDGVLHLAGDPSHAVPPVPEGVFVLDDAAAVGVWAADRGLALDVAVRASLEGLEPARFVVVALEHAGGKVRSPTVRVVSPGVNAALPLLLTRAGPKPVAVSAFVIAEGRGALAGGELQAIDGEKLAFDAASGTSNYAAVRDEALAEAGSYLIESAAPISEATPLPGGDQVDGLLVEYFTRAEAYLDGVEAEGCIAAASQAMGSSGAVAAVCPRASLGVVGGGSCDEDVAPGEIDPSALRCAAAADDLAVALSGMVPSQAWLTRIALRIGALVAGPVADATVAAGEAVSPLLRAGSIVTSGCGGGEGGGGAGAGSPGSGSGSGASSGSGGTVEVPVYQVRDGCGSRNVDLAYILYVDEGEADADYYYYETDDCGGETEGSYSPGYGYVEGDPGGYDDGYDDPPAALEDGEGCGGETDDSYDDGYDGGDDCGGETDDSYDSTDDDCGGDSGDGYDSGDDGCGGGSDDGYDSGDGCGGGSDDSSDCAISTTRGKRQRRPKLSALTLLAVAILTPARRLSRRRASTRR